MLVSKHVAQSIDREQSEVIQELANTNCMPKKMGMGWGHYNIKKTKNSVLKPSHILKLLFLREKNIGNKKMNFEHVKKPIISPFLWGGVEGGGSGSRRFA